ncbi:MAG: FHA domain-containing protein [Kiritimatiellaeota bacterium]|nr:FHA domain-containing protein [Kiritimatiellota bacterium]
MYRLIFQNGPQRGRRVAIRQGPVILGRHPDAALRLPEPEVALQHALLEDQPDGGVRLRRLTAGALICVNRQEVETADLRDGDVIEIGPHVLQFSSAGAEARIKPTGRRVGGLQLLTLGAVGLLLVGQLIFLFVVSLTPPKPTVVAAADTNAPTVAAVSAPTSTPQVITATNLLAQVPTQLPPRVVSIPTAVPVRVASVMPPQDNATSNEMKKMQAEIAQLRHEVSTLPPPKPATITNLVTAAVVPEPTPVPLVTNPPAPDMSADDLVLAQARKMFTKALDRVTTLDAEELDGELATIQNMAPDFLPPFIERAQRLQQRGLNAEALEQWKRVLKLATGGDLRARATEEIATIQKRLAAPPKPKPEVRSPKPEISETKAPVKVFMPRVKQVRAAQPVARIAQVEPQKLLAGDNFDEMRLLRISVAPTGAAPLDLATTEIRVIFFDRSEKSGRVMPSRAVVPGAALHAAAPVTATSQLEFAASYLVPRGFRQREQQQVDDTRRYFGYRIELLCRGELQERRDQPPNLLPVE